MSARAFTAAELAAMRVPGLPGSARAIRRRAAREGWATDDRSGRGGRSLAYLLDTLPRDIRAALETPAEEAQLDARLERAVLDRIAMVQRIADSVTRGASCTVAVEDAARAYRCSSRTARRAYDLVRHRPVAEWSTLLAPKWRAGTRFETAAIHPEAWDYFKSDYLAPEEPAAKACYRRTCDVAKTRPHWGQLPSYRTFFRRLLREVPAATRTFCRKGEEAFLRRAVPPQIRSRAHLAALDAVVGDGHKLDVFVRVPGVQAPKRAMLVGLQDLYSGKLIAWRIGVAESSEEVRLAMADVVLTWGIPRAAYFDNGMAFAAKVNTGGTRTRFRYRADDDEAKGVFTRLGIEVHWATPYHGQSKPIERFFRDVAEELSKHPAFRGAYTGRSHDTKPENYGSRAVDLDELVEMAGPIIARLNARDGRETEVCRGRSYDAVFEESYSRATIRKVTEAEARFLLLPSVKLRVRRTHANLRLHGNIYWCAALVEHESRELIVHYDPAELKRGLFVYDTSGRYIGFAACQHAVGFDDVAAAKAVARKKAETLKLARKSAALERPLSSRELDEMHRPAIGAPPRKPRAGVIAPNFRSRVELPPASGPSHVRVELGPTAEELAERERREDQIREMGRIAMASLEGHRRRRVANDDD